MLDLGPHQIHLWQYAIGNPLIAEHVSYARTLLSDAEKQRCAAFHFEQHRTEYALSHAIVRLALSQYASVEPSAWQFVTGQWGKPEIALPLLDTPLWFNLSHTTGFIVCVTGRVRKLGVDVENINRMTDCAVIAERFFAPVEAAYVRSLPLNEQRDSFFRIWTLKEAYIKAEGKGLSIPLDSFHFSFSPLTLFTESNPGGWSFFEFQPDVDYRISIGVQGDGAFEVECRDAASLF